MKINNYYKSDVIMKTSSLCPLKIAARWSQIRDCDGHYQILWQGSVLISNPVTIFTQKTTTSSAIQVNLAGPNVLWENDGVGFAGSSVGCRFELLSFRHLFVFSHLCHKKFAGKEMPEEACLRNPPIYEIKNVYLCL